LIKKYATVLLDKYVGTDTMPCHPNSHRIKDTIQKYIKSA